MQWTEYQLMERENEAGLGRHGGQRFKKTYMQEVSPIKSTHYPTTTARVTD